MSKLKEFKKIGLVICFAPEINVIWPQIKDQKINKKGPFEIIEGKINNHHVVTTLTGVSMVNAAMVTQYLIDTEHPDFILNFGCSAGLKEGHQRYDIVIGDKADQINTSFKDLWLQEYDVENDYPLFKLVEPNDLPQEDSTGKKFVVDFGGISISSIFASPGEFYKVKDQTDALAYDMESTAVAQVAYRNSLPCSVVRVVSDTGDVSSIYEDEESKKLTDDILRHGSEFVLQLFD